MKESVKIRYVLYLIVIVPLLFLLDGCSLTKKAVISGKVMSENENIVRKVYNTEPDWNYVDIRLTGKAVEEDEKVGFIGSIKILKNKELFIVLRSPIGIELARVFADRDSIWLISKMLGLKEKFDWNRAVLKLRYPLDFNSIQGIFVQSLFTSSGEHVEQLINNLLVRKEESSLKLISRTDLNGGGIVLKYYNDFTINPSSYVIDALRIRDINGQWITEINYLYNKENNIKKIQISGIDTSRKYDVDINIIKMEFSNISNINFDKF